MLGEGTNDNDRSRETNIDGQEDDGPTATDLYEQDGYGQDEDGNYMNPYTGQYDPNYDPETDELYNDTRFNEQGEGLEGEEEQEGIEQPRWNEPEELEEPEIPEDPEDESMWERFKGTKAGRSFTRHASATAAAAKVAGKKAIKAAPRTIKGVATGLAVGGASAIAATAVTAAMGDPGKVATAVTASVGGGYMAGKASAKSSKFKDRLDPDVRAAYEDTLNGPEYKEEAMKEKIQKMKKNDRNRRKLEQALGKEKAEEMMARGGNFEKFVQNGIDKVEDIQALQKMIDSNEVRNVDHATAIYNQNKRMGGKDLKNMHDSDKTKWRNTFVKEYKDAGASDARAEQTADNTFKLVQSFQNNKKN